MVLRLKLDQAFWRRPQRGDRHVFHNQVRVLEVGFCVVGAEEHFELYRLVALDFALLRYYSVVGLFVAKGNFVRVLFAIDGPVEGHCDR